MIGIDSAWFILEIETGLIDGWYYNFNPDEAVKILEHWNNVRSEFNHIMCITPIKYTPYLTDDNSLPVQYRKSL